MKLNLIKQSTFFLCSLIFIPQSLYANCGAMAEGAVYRLDQENRSLANAKVQDQDGLGSCYSNQASLLLQSAIPGNPDISYLNLSLFYTQNHIVAPQGATAVSSFTNPPTFIDAQVSTSESALINGGFSCDAINDAVERQKKSPQGVLCQAKDVALEHAFFFKDGVYSDPTFQQGKSILEASRYMNAFQKRFSDTFTPAEVQSTELRRKKREEAEKFQKALKEFIAKNGDAYAVQECSAPKPEKLVEVVESTMAKAFHRFPECIKNKRMNTAIPECEVLDKLGSITQVINGNSSQFEFELHKRVKDGIEKKIDQFYNPENKSGVDLNKALIDIVKNEYEQMTNVKNLTNKESLRDKNKLKKDNKLTQRNSRSPIDPKLSDKKHEKILNANPAENVFNNLSRLVSPEDQSTVKDEHARVVMQDFNKCKQEKLLDFLKDKNQFVATSKTDSVLCEFNDLILAAHQLAATLPFGVVKNADDFINFVTKNAGLKYDEAILSLIASDCTPEKRIKIPENLMCYDQRILINEQTAKGIPTSIPFDALVNQYRGQIIGQLKANKAVGMDVCTKFFNYPSYNFHELPEATKYNDCQNSGPHGMHAMTIIGYRCKDNKIQYLSQNSWGPNWHLEGGHYEIEKGKIWLDEEKLVKNLDRLNFLAP
jgi:hypothetical protein